MKTVGRPVWKWTFVERPPMSQRSHIAQSGRRAISECSAACSEPSSRRSESRSSVKSGGGTNQIASVSNSVCGRSRRTISKPSWVAIFFFWYATTCSVTTTRPKWTSTPCRRVVASGPDEAGLGLLEVRERCRPLERLFAEHLPVGVVERGLERGGANVAVEDAGVLVVEDRGFDAAAEKRLRRAHEVLVEGVLARD